MPHHVDWWDLMGERWPSVRCHFLTCCCPLGATRAAALMLWILESMGNQKKTMKITMNMNSKCHPRKVMETGNWCYIYIIYIPYIFLYHIYIYYICSTVMVVFFVSGLPYGVLKSNSLVFPVASPYYWAFVTRLLIAQNFAQWPGHYAVKQSTESPGSLNGW